MRLVRFQIIISFATLLALSFTTTQSAWAGHKAGHGAGEPSLIERIEALEAAIADLTTPPQSEVEVDCDSGSLLQAAIDAAPQGQSIIVSGTCEEHLMVMTDKLSLIGSPSFIVHAPTDQVTALEINGADGVRVENAVLMNGNNGLAVTAGAAAVLINIEARDNLGDGIQVSNGSYASLTDVVAENNGLNGIHATTVSGLVINGENRSTLNGSAGLRAARTSSVLSLSGAILEMNENSSRGIGIGTSSNGTFVDSLITANLNGGDGVIVVDGADIGLFDVDMETNENGGSGVFLGISSSAEIGSSAIDINDNLGFGFIIKDSSTALVLGTEIFAENNGSEFASVKVQRASSLAISSGSSIMISNSAADGVNITESSSLSVSPDSPLSISDSASVGLFIGTSSSLVATEAALNFTNNAGGDLIVSSGSEVELSP